MPRSLTEIQRELSKSNSNKIDLNSLLKYQSKSNKLPSVYEGEYNLGIDPLNSYDTGLTVGGNQASLRNENQSGFGQALNILGRATNTFGTAFLEGAAIPLGSPVALMDSLSGGGNFSDNLFRNPLIRGIESLQQTIAENLPIYLTEEQQQDKNLMDYITTPNKLFDDLGQGIGFLAAQLVPTGWIGSAFSKGSKLSRWFEEAALAKYGLKGLNKLDDIAKAKLAQQGINFAELQSKLAGTQKILDKTGIVTGSLIGRLGESAMEANQTYDEIYNSLLERGLTEEQASQVAREQSNKVFGFNMALAIPDAFQYLTAFKGFSKLAKSLDNNLASKASSLIDIDSAGKAVVKPLSKLEKVGNKIWSIGKQAAIESEEEGLQSTFQLAAKKLALDIADGKTVDGYLQSVLNNYSDSWTTIEGQKARLLGAILGGGATGISSIGENRKAEQLAGELVGSEEEGNDNPFSLNQQVYQKDKIDPDKRFIQLEDGGIQLNNQYLRGLNNFTQIEEAKKVAQLQNDEVEYNRLSDLQLVSQAIAYSEADKLDQLVEKYETLSKASPSEVEELNGKPLDENTTVDQVIKPKIERIKQIGKLYEDINNDPTLGSLSADTKRLIAYKLAIFDNNKKALQDVTDELTKLTAKNATWVSNSWLTENESLDQLSKEQLEQITKESTDKWKGLTGLDKEKAIKLETKSKEIVEENKDILEWYDKARGNLAELDEQVKEFNEAKDVIKPEEKIEEAKQQEATNTLEGLQSQLDILNKKYEEALSSGNTNLADQIVEQMKTVQKQIDDLTKIPESNNTKANNNTVNTNNPETTETGEEDIKPFQEYRKKLIDVHGFGTTYGSFFSFKTDEKDKPNEDITQRRWFSFTENIDLDKEQYRLLFVTTKHPEYGFGKPQSIFTVDDPNNIQVLACDENGNPVYHLNGLVHTSIAEPKTEDTQGNFRFAFGNKKLSEEEQNALVEKQRQQHEQFRAKLLENPTINYYTDVLGVSNGIMQTEPLGLSYSVLGRIVQNKSEFKNVKIRVAKGKDKKVSVETPSGESFNVSNGLPYVVYKNRVVPLSTRKLINSEVTTALELIKSYIENYKESKNKIKGIDKSITSILQDFVYMSPKDSEFKLWLDKDSLIIGDKTLTSEEILSGANDPIIREFLSNKIHQVNSARLSETTPYTQYSVVFDDNQRKIRQTKFANYTEYLLTNPNEDDNAPLTTRLKMNYIDNPALNEEDKLQNVQFANAYFIFDNNPDNLSNTKEAIRDSSSNEDKSTLEELTIDKIASYANGTVFQYRYMGLVYEFTKDDNSIKDIRVVENTRGLHQSVVDGTFSKKLFDDKANFPALFFLKQEVKQDQERFEVFDLPIADEQKETRDSEVTQQDIDDWKELTGNKNNLTDEEIKRRLESLDTEDKYNRLPKVAIENPLSEEEVNHIKSLLPKEVSYELVKGLIDSKAIGRVLSSGKVLISDLATEGTAYHEAYHIVSLFVLKPHERYELYQEYRERTNQPLLTTKQAEEALAEEFRDYMLLNGDYKLPEKQKSLFQRIVSFIKGLLGLDKNRIEEIFNKISSAEYKNSELNVYRLNEAYYSEKNISLDNPNDLKEIVSAMTYDFFDILFKKRDTIANLFNGRINVDEIYADIFFKYKKSTNSIGKQYLTSSIPLFNRAKIKHALYLQTFGIKVYNVDNEQNEGDPYEEGIDENDRSKDSLGIDLAIESSTKDGMPRLTKWLIAGLKAYKKKGKPSENSVPVINSLGMETAVDFDSTLNYLQNKLAGKSDYPSMIKVIEELSLLQPTYTDLLNKLRSTTVITTPQSLSSQQVDLQTSFFQQFSKTKHTYITTVYDEERNVIFFSDSNKEQLRDRIRSKWQSNLKANINSKYLINKDGVLYLNKEELKKIHTEKDRAGKIHFLKAIGIELTNPKEVDFTGFNELKEAILKVDNVRDIFDKNVDSQTRLKKIIDSQIESSDDIPELQHLNQEGKTVYSITLNNFLSLVANKLNEGVIPDYLQPLNKEGEVINSYTVNSQILKHIQDKGTISIEVLEGIDYNQDGTATSELTQGDRLLQSFFATLNGKYPLLRASDKKMEFGISLLTEGSKVKPFISSKNKTFDEIITETVELLKLYLNDEVETIINSKGAYSNYRKNNNDFSIFSRIILFETQFKLLEGASIEELPNVDQEIKSYIYDKIAENKAYLEEYNIVTPVGEHFKFNTLLQETIKGITSKETNILDRVDSNKIIGAFTVNSLVANIEQTKLFTGNLGFYKDLTDLFKRVSGLTGTKKIARTDSEFNYWLAEYFKRKDGKQPDGLINTIVFDDVSGFEDLPDYVKYDEADAQGYITLDEYRELYKRIGDWSDAQEELYQDVINGRKSKSKAIFNPIKPQYFGNQINNIGFVPTFYKFSLLPLYPSMFPEGSKLESLYNKMQEKQVGIALFASGNKVGRKLDNRGKGQKFYDNEGNIAELDSKLIQQIDYSYFGIQVENKGYKDEVVTGTQFRAVIQSNLYSEGKPISEEAKRLATKFDDTINKLTEIARQELLEDLSIIEEGTDYKIKDVTKLKKYLIEQSKKRQVPDNIIVGIQKVLDATNPTKYFELLVNKDKIENLLFALVNNNVIKQKTPGNMAVQAASTGFETTNRVQRQEDNSWAKSEDSLQFYRKEDGTIKEMEVLLPYTFRTYFGNIPIEKIDSKLLTLIGFRIPTEQLNSIDAIKIKGFLPKESGNVVVVPSGLVKKAGSDFDIDKLTLFFPNYKVNTTINAKRFNKILQELIEERELSVPKIDDFLEYITKAVEESKKDWNNASEFDKAIKEAYDSSREQELEYIKYNEEEPTKEGLQNRLIEISRDILTLDNNFDALVAPNSIEELQELKKEISGDKKETSFTKAVEWKYISDIADQYWKGKALVGVFALQNKHHILTQKVDLKVRTNIHFKGFEGEEHSLGRIHSIGEDGKSTKESISKTNGQLVSTVVDVAKNPDILTGLNINFDTANTISYLIRLGVPKETVFYFINQPIIKAYLDKVEKNSRAKFLKVEDENQSINSIQKEFLKNDTKTNIPISLRKLKTLSKQSVDLKDQKQLQILRNFLSYKEEAQKLSNLITAFGHDTHGVGKNRNDLRLYLDKFDSIMNDDFFINQDKLYADTFLYEFINSVTDAQKFYRELFITEKPELRNILNDIKNELVSRGNLKQDQILKLLDLAENDLVTYLLSSLKQNDQQGINTQLNSLFKGVNSLPRRFNEYIKANPNSVIAKEFVPIFNRESTIDNIKLFTKRLNYWESNNLTNALSDLKETSPTLYEDLVKFSILQSGLSISPISFTNIIPNEDFIKISSQILSTVDNFNVSLLDFKGQFYKNNWSNNQLVPKESARDREGNLKSKDSISVINFKAKALYVKTVVNIGTKQVPKFETRLYQRSEEGEKYTKYIRTNKFGDGIYLKEYGVNTSIIPNNDYQNNTPINQKEEQPNNALPDLGEENLDCYK